MWPPATPRDSWLRTNPKAAIEKELAMSIPEGVKIEVIVENPADNTWHLVIPARPQALHRELTETDLVAVAGGLSGHRGTST
jgi:hypothetical protein